MFLFLFQIKNNPLNPAHATAKSIKANKIKKHKRGGYRNQLEMCAFPFFFGNHRFSCDLLTQQAAYYFSLKCSHTHTYIYTYIAYMSMPLLVEIDCNLSDLTKLFMELRARHITEL